LKLGKLFRLAFEAIERVIDCAIAQCSKTLYAHINADIRCGFMGQRHRVIFNLDRDEPVHTFPAYRDIFWNTDNRSAIAIRYPTNFGQEYFV
jgi:hypothetical protein